MNEFIKVFKQFFYRDIIFLFGGMVFIASISTYFLGDQILFLFRYNNLVVTIAFLTLCYVIGFLLQELANILQIININTKFKTCGYSRFLFRCFTREKWESIEKEYQIKDKLDPIKSLYRIDSHINDFMHGRFERIVSLKQISNVCGSSFLFSFIPLLATAIKSKHPTNLAFALIVLFISILFINLSWIKGMQQMHWMAKMDSIIQDNNDSAISKEKMFVFVKKRST